MGRTGYKDWKTPKDIQKEVTNPERWAPTHSIIATRTTSYGRHIWIGIHNILDDLTYIKLYLVEGKSPNLTYADMTEEMEPYTYDCPLDLLDKVPAPKDKGSVVWRQKVYEYHQKRQKVFNPGNIVTVYNRPEQFEIISNKGNNSYLIQSRNTSKIYKCSAKNMSLFTPNPS